MDADGGFSEYSTNKVSFSLQPERRTRLLEGTQCGAKYGTGYCDTQCPNEIKVS